MKKCKCGKTIQPQYRLCYLCLMGKQPKVNWVKRYFQPVTKKYIEFRNALDEVIHNIYARKN